jgi:preprotein translocase subunit SecA
MPETLAKFWGADGGALAQAPYAERAEKRDNWVDRKAARIFGNIRAALRPRRLGRSAFVNAVTTRSEALAAGTPAALLEAAARHRPALLHKGFTDANLVEAFALARAATQQTLGIAQRPVQIYGARELIRGTMLEMATGEGKTLTAALTTATVGLAGGPVHVVTVNGYLAERDCEELQPIYAALGLRAGVVINGMEDAERRAAYAAEITHVESKELCFDYLRDWLATAGRRGGGRQRIGAHFSPRARARPLMLRGLHFAIVDEADSVLIDEAKTPLIISQDAPITAAEAERLRGATRLSGQLARHRDWRVFGETREVRLTSAGRARLERLTRQMTGLWRVARAREEAVTQALSAQHLFHRDQHYMVIDDAVQIVDEYTGRAQPDRSWQAGLHQLVELKEGVPLTGVRTPIARISFQRFFRRYRRLSGMTGTGMEISGEVWSDFDLRTTPVPLHAPLRRVGAGRKLFASPDARWDAVVAAVRRAAEREGRPVLVGVRSVEASDILSARLAAAGIAHVVLNARQDAEEAEIVARAGHVGAVTVATNMAGRGTDIALTPAARRNGGLHVILTEFHDSTRIDRQLIGRAGRQGDPGSWEALVSVEDELFTRYAAPLQRALRGLRWRNRMPRPVLALLRRVAQTRAEAQGRRIRIAQMRADRDLDKKLAFTGPPT